MNKKSTIPPEGNFISKALKKRILLIGKCFTGFFWFYELIIICFSVIVAYYYSIIFFMAFPLEEISQPFFFIGGIFSFFLLSYSATLIIAGILKKVRNIDFSNYHIKLLVKICVLIAFALYVFTKGTEESGERFYAFLGETFGIFFFPFFFFLIFSILILGEIITQIFFIIIIFFFITGLFSEKTGFYFEIININFQTFFPEYFNFFSKIFFGPYYFVVLTILLFTEPFSLRPFLEKQLKNF